MYRLTLRKLMSKTNDLVNFNNKENSYDTIYMFYYI